MIKFICEVFTIKTHEHIESWVQEADSLEACRVLVERGYDPAVYSVTITYR